MYSKDAEADRAFFRDVLGFKSVDAGHGWLIFALPPAEAAVHPDEGNHRHELYLMCDDLKTEMSALKKKGVACSEIKKLDGVRSRRSGFLAGETLVFTSRSIPRHWVWGHADLAGTRCRLAGPAIK